MSTSRRSFPASSKRPSSMSRTTSAQTSNVELATIGEPSVSAHSRFYSMSSTSYPPPEHNRSPSPPASSYFTSFADTEFGEPQPTPGATNHFAYSTTLRRHHAEPMGLVPPKLSDIAPVAAAEGLFDKVLGAVTGKRGRDDVELLINRSSSPRMNREEKRDTPSARFSTWSVEVGHLLLVLPCSLQRRIFCIENQGRHSHTSRRIPNSYLI